LNDEFLTKDKAYRLIGEEIDFKEFKKEDKKIKVDARVEIEPKVEKTPEQRKIEAMELYKIFVAEDKPDPGDEEAIKTWKIRKRTLQKKILEEFGMEAYEDLIIGEEKEEAPKPPEVSAPPSAEVPASSIAPPVEALSGMPPMTPPVAPPAARPTPRLLRRLAAKIPIIGRIAT